MSLDCLVNSVTSNEDNSKKRKIIDFDDRSHVGNVFDWMDSFDEDNESLESTDSETTNNSNFFDVIYQQNEEDLQNPKKIKRNYENGFDYFTKLPIDDICQCIIYERDILLLVKMAGCSRMTAVLSLYYNNDNLLNALTSLCKPNR
jgi:hypothetical protein